GPLVGEKIVIVGVVDCDVTVKLLELEKVPAGVTTLIGPLIAPAGTVVVMRVGLTIVKSAFAPVNRTAVTSERFVPKIVTAVPAEPLAGKKLPIAASMVKELWLVTVPAAFVTLIGPL